MATIIDNIQLDETNVEFNCAADFVKHTDRLLYLTGKAGTGKTTFLIYLRATTTKNTVILTPTGFAAINAGGLIAKNEKSQLFSKIKRGATPP
jgi:hypothetical protein